MKAKGQIASGRVIFEQTKTLDRLCEVKPGGDRFRHITDACAGLFGATGFPWLIFAGKSIRRWTLVNILSVLLALMLDLTGGERALILALGLLILAAELSNTALEDAVDFISTAQHPLA